MYTTTISNFARRLSSTMVTNTHKTQPWTMPVRENGEFKRSESQFRDWISSSEGAKFPPEKGRYHLVCWN